MGFLFLSDYFFKQTTATNKQTSKPRIIFLFFSLLDRSIWNRLFERIGKPYKRQPVRGLRFAEYLPQSRRFFCSLFGRCRLFLCYPFFMLIIDFWFSFILWAITIAELIVLALSTSLPDTRILNHSRKFGFLHIVIILFFPFVRSSWLRQAQPRLFQVRGEQAFRLPFRHWHRLQELHLCAFAQWRYWFPRSETRGFGFYYLDSYI